MGKGLVRSLLAKYLPDFRNEPLQPDDLKAVYTPVWFVDGEVMGKMIKSGNEVREVKWCKEDMVSRLVRRWRSFIR